MNNGVNCGRENGCVETGNKALCQMRRAQVMIQVDTNSTNTKVSMGVGFPSTQRVVLVSAPDTI